MTETLTDDSEVPAKKKRGLVKLILIAFVVTVVTAAAVVGAVVYRDSRAVDDHFAKGNAKYDQAFNELEEALLDLGGVRISDSDADSLQRESQDMLEGLPKAEKALREARTQFQAMRRAGFSKTDTNIAAMSEKSVVEAERGITVLSGRIERLSTTADLLSKLRKAADKFQAGFAKNNEAINAGNEDKFPEASAYSDEAAKLFSEAKTLVAQANELVLDRELVDASAGLGRAQAWAQATKKMMAAGSEKKLDEYNRYARENNDLSTKINEIAKDRILSDPDGWMRDQIDRQDERIRKAFKRADLYRERALSRWSENT